jgi:hypothetical protein
MTETFLISEAKLREYTSIDNNVDTALIKNAIRESQDIELQRVLGTLLYDKIISLVNAGTIGDSANSAYKTLLDDYIQNFLLYAAYYYALDTIYLRSRNNGLLTPSGGENSELASKQLYDMKRQSTKNKMEFYSQKLRDYLIEEEGSYPELTQANKLYEQDPDYDNQYGSPFVFRQDAYATEALKRGIPVFDKRYKQYPWAYTYSNKNTPK